MTDERLEQLLRECARGYNRPPEVPREEMWARISAGRRRARGFAHYRRNRGLHGGDTHRPIDGRGGRGRGARARWFWWPAAAAAALVVGFALGRLDRPASPAAPAVAERTARTEARRAAIYARAAAPYLGRVEALLTLVQDAAEPSRAALPVSTWAEELLAETRLLLDSPAGEDEAMRQLLRDLELVLVQIVMSSGPRGDRDGETIRESIRRRAILTRLRGRIPAGQAGGA